jgi:hypothetical protein
MTQGLLLKHVTALARHVVSLPSERVVSVVKPTVSFVSASPAVLLVKSVKFLKTCFVGTLPNTSLTFP